MLMRGFKATRVVGAGRHNAARLPSRDRLVWGFDRVRAVANVFLFASAFCLLTFTVTGMHADDDIDARSEAKGFFDGLQVRFENLESYDVLLDISKSILVDDLVIPSATSRWRLRYDRQSKFFCFIELGEQFSRESYATGRFDDGVMVMNVTVIDGPDLKMQISGSRSVTQRFETHDAAMETAPIPTLSYLGTGEFTSACLDPDRQRQRLARILGATRDLHVASSAEKGCCDIRAVFGGESRSE